MQIKNNPFSIPSYLWSWVGMCSWTFISACHFNQEVADTILFNGKLITVDKDFSLMEAVSIKGGRILAVGNSEEILSGKGDSTVIIDLKGHAVIPGIIEGHSHLIAASKSEFFDEIPVIGNVEETLEWISAEVRNIDPGEWIIHPKFFFTRLEEMRQLTKMELDAVAPDNPVFLNGSYGGMVNTKALEVSGMMDSNHSGILKDSNSGEATGMIRSSAFKLLPIEDKLSDLSMEQQLKALQSLILNYNKIGITSVVSGKGTLKELELFGQLKDKNALNIRVFHNIMYPYHPDATTEELRAAVKDIGYKTEDGDEWIKIGALKTVLDGGVLTGTAFLRAPWGEVAREVYGITDNEYRGELFHSKETLVQMITVAEELGWKFTAHVTGGGAVDTLLAAFEAVNHVNPIDKKRFSIIHGNFFTSEAIKKMAQLGIYADMQPAWFFKDTQLLLKVLGQERMQTFHPYHSMMEAGIMVNGGSDHMVKLDPETSINPYNPFLGMWSVITRKTERGDIINPSEAISRRNALEMYTINNAYASFEEDIKGSIEEGKLADLVVLSDDLLSCPESQIRRITPVLTLIDGRVVYDSGVLSR
ncbi:MAG: amidohydrolase [Cyclobacteriaceae bacterium]